MMSMAVFCMWLRLRLATRVAVQERRFLDAASMYDDCKMLAVSFVPAGLVDYLLVAGLV